MRRRWGDPSTVAALLLLLFSLGMIVADGADEVLFGHAVSFGYWPYVLMGLVSFWFFGIRLPGPPGDNGKGEA